MASWLIDQCLDDHSSSKGSCAGLTLAAGRPTPWWPACSSSAACSWSNPYLPIPNHWDPIQGAVRADFSTLVDGKTTLKNMSSSVGMMTLTLYGKKCSKPPTSIILYNIRCIPGMNLFIHSCWRNLAALKFDHFGRSRPLRRFPAWCLSVWDERWRIGVMMGDGMAWGISCRRTPRTQIIAMWKANLQRSLDTGAEVLFKDLNFRH
jgi:hypothetical protein